MPVNWELSAPEEAADAEKKEFQLGEVISKPTERKELQTHQEVPPKK